MLATQELGFTSLRYLVSAAAAPPMAVIGSLLAGSPAAAIEFDEADIFFELNATDRDLGVHVALDAEGWKELRINRPDGNRMIEVEPRGNLARIGLTELFFEGEEPSLVQVPAREFFRRVPPGTYTFLGTTTGNQPLRSTDRLTTELPCPVTVLSPPEDDPVDIGEVVVRWAPPGIYNADTQRCDRSRNVGLVGYQVIVEMANEARDFERDLVVDFSPDARRLFVPRGFLLQGARLPGTEFKVEIIAIEDTGNATIVEQDFEVSTAD